jgi:DNA repair exonuclease SbcCD ATPase subunit
MQPTSLHVRSITSLHDLKVDLTQVPPGICAVVGENGAGKTSLLECMLPAPVWGTMPTRPGALADCVTGRDGLIDLVQTHHGIEYRHLMTIDVGASSKSRPKTEAYLYIDGEPANDGKLGTYHEAVAAHLPPEHLVLASAFAAQDGSGSFAALDVHGRRKLFRAMLGLDGLQKLADRAASHRKPLDAMATDLDRQALKLDEDTTAGDILDFQVIHADGQTPQIRDTVGVRRGAHVEAQTLHAEQAALLGQLAKARDAAVTSRERLTSARDDADHRQQAAQRQLDAAEAMLQQATQIEADAARRTELLAERDNHAVGYREARANIVRMDAAAADRQASRARTRRELTRVSEQLASATQAEGEMAGLVDDAQRQAAAKQERPTLVVKADEAVRVHREASEVAQERRRVAVRDLDVAGAELQRAIRDAEALDKVPCGGRKIWDAGDHGGSPRAGVRLDCSTCSMLGTAAEARDALPRLRAANEAAEQEAIAARAGVDQVAGQQGRLAHQPTGGSRPPSLDRPGPARPR